MKKIQLFIPEPCQEHWDNMIPTQQGRFCNACAKEVIDFSELSDTEILNYFSKAKNEKICGRAWPDQLGRDITVMPRKKFYWCWNYVIALFIFLSKSGNSKAQQTASAGVTRSSGGLKKIPKMVGDLAPLSKLSIGGTVKNDAGKAIPFASIKLVNSRYGTNADEYGCYAVMVDSMGVVLQVSAIGYKTKQVQLNAAADQEIVLERSGDLMKEVVILAAPIRGRVGGMMVSCTASKRKIIKDSIANWISNFSPVMKIYPNPVPKQHAFTVAIKLKQTGSYSLQFTDATGRLMEERKINAIAKNHQEQLPANSWNAGIYFVNLVDEKGKPVGTGSFMIR